MDFYFLGPLVMRAHMSDTTPIDALCVAPIFTLSPELYARCRDDDFVRSVLDACDARDVGEWGGDVINRLLHVHQFNSAHRERTRPHLERLLARYNEE